MSDCSCNPSCSCKKSCSTSAPFLVAAIAVAVSLSVSGWFVRDGLRGFNANDRIVSVKGLAEQNVEADLAIWGLSHTVTGNDLGEVQAKSEANEKALREMLAGAGFAATEITSGVVQAQDLLAQSYRPENIEQGRYIVTQTVTLRTADLGKIEKAQQGFGDLLRKGITLSSQQSPAYVFTKLNEIKPKMLAEATRNARDAAAEFAKESGAKVGDIKRANQGVFQIIPRDLQVESEQYQRFKTVRVVSTVDFHLQQ